MRILHTSDWHLGRSFGPMSLGADQEAFTDWFVDLARDQQADLVVIAGDLYDRAIAPTEAIALFRDTVRRLLDLGVIVAAITGNHDGAGRVAPYDDLLDRSGLYLRGGYHGIGSVIRHEFADGPLDLVLLPFLDPQAAPDTHGHGDAPGEDAAADALARRRARTHESVLRAAVDLVAGALRAPRSLAVAHAFVTGGATSESERQLVVGGTGEVPVELLAPFSYAALGHLHRPQAVGADTIRYSGTPLAYSFSEEHEKSVAAVDLTPDGQATVELVPIGVGRRVRTLTGEMADLLDPNRHPDAADCFVRAIVTDRDTVLDAKVRLAERYPHIVEVKLAPLRDGEAAADAPATIATMTPIEATRAFWEAAEGAPPDDEIDAVLRDALTTAEGGEP